MQKNICRPICLQLIQQYLVKPLGKDKDTLENNHYQFCQEEYRCQNIISIHSVLSPCTQ
jgi:hypothetical protein